MEPLLSPIEHVVVLVMLGTEKLTEEISKISIIGLLLKGQRSDIVNISSEFIRKKALAELFT